MKLLKNTFAKYKEGTKREVDKINLSFYDGTEIKDLGRLVQGQEWAATCKLH